MGSKQGKRVWGRAGRALAALAAAGVLGAAGALAFVPSAEEELARAYPPALKGDLGACADPAARLVPDTRADLAGFAGRLNGTWKLRSRTKQGLGVDAGGRAGRLYFDLGPVEGGQASGAALLVDEPAAGAARAGGTAAGFWSLTLAPAAEGRIALRLEGESLGGYANVRAAERQAHEFFEQDGVFVSTFDDGAPARAWDRIVVMESSLTYVSCADGVVERYVKVSGQKPQIEGASLREHWQKLKSARKVALFGDRGGTAAIARAFGR